MRTAAELFAEIQANLAERGLRLIRSDEGTFEEASGEKVVRDTPM
jgi:hypothetical protein